MHFLRTICLVLGDAKERRVTVVQMWSHKCVNKSLRWLRTKEFPNLANIIQAMKSLAADLTSVNGHRHIGVKPGNQVSNTVERLDGRMMDPLQLLIIDDGNQQLRTQSSNCCLTGGYKSTMRGHLRCRPLQKLWRGLAKNGRYDVKIICYSILATVGCTSVNYS